MNLKDIQKFVDKKYKPGYEKVVRAGLIATSSAIIKATPVDTGRARANWFPSIGTIKHGTSTLTEVITTIEDAPGKVFYLTNNLPYIKPLEFGSSKQAPQGMVRVAVANFEPAIKKAIANLK